MKKSILAVLAVVALPLAFTSCSDENDLPQVEYNIQIGGGVIDQATNDIYVVQGDTLKIESVSVTNLESNKEAAVTGAQYYWDYNFIGGSPFPPYGFNIYINENVPTGGHLLTIRTGVVAVDKEPAYGIIDCPVVVVSDSTEIPSTAVSTFVKTTSKLEE